MAYIYKITNTINNKVYIGKTLYTIQRRWNQHLLNARTREDLWHLPLYAAMRCHGIENFMISEVEKVDDYKKLSQREQYWITQYDSYKYGYNATLGGDGALLYDYDYIWQLWEKGLKIKQISKEVQCNDFVVRTVLNLHNVSTEDRKIRSYEDQLASHKPYQRAVEQLDPNTQQVVAEYPSIAEAGKAMHGDSSCIGKACRGIVKTSYGYKWRYKEGDTYTKKSFAARQVCKLDLKTKKLIQIYPSLTAAAKDVNGDSSYLSKVCRGKQHSSKGFAWCYLEDYQT